MIGGLLASTSAVKDSAIFNARTVFVLTTTSQLSLFSSFSLAPSPTRLAPAAEAARLEYSVEVMWLLICLLRPAFKITLIALCLRGESTRLEPEQVKTPPSWALTPASLGGPTFEEREPRGQGPSN